MHVQIIGLEQELADMHYQCSQMHVHVEEAERKSADVSSQLAIVLASQQQQMHHDLEIKTSLERTKMEKTRLERELVVRIRISFVLGPLYIYINAYIYMYYFLDLNQKQRRGKHFGLLHTFHMYFFKFTLLHDISALKKSLA
jgi:hypothetical protein